MSGTFQIKRGDTAIPITGTLKNGDGSVVDLTGATVKFVMTPIDVLTPPKVNGNATVDAIPTSGKVSYPWVAGDVDTCGYYDVEWIATFPSSKPVHYPGTDFDRVVIEMGLA